MLFWIEFLREAGVRLVLVLAVAPVIVVVLALIVGVVTTRSFAREQGDDSRPLAEWARSAGWEAETAGYVPVIEDGKVRKKVRELLKGEVQGVELKGTAAQQASCSAAAIARSMPSVEIHPSSNATTTRRV